jgi:6-phosphogluconolactonase (cycloisomerase 2 family)
MMFRSFGQAALALVFTLGLAPLLTSCGNGHTIAYAYVLSSPNSTTCSIWTYKVNNQTGDFSPAQTPSIPCTAGQASPIDAVVSPDSQFLYVLFGPASGSGTTPPFPNGQDLVVAYGITRDDGTITPLYSYNTAGTEPVALTMDPAGQYLYVVDYYQPAFSNSNPGPGDLTMFAIAPSSGANPGSLTAPACPNGVPNAANICYYDVGYAPRGVTQLANASYVYVTNSGSTTVPCSSTVSGFKLNSSGGSFTGLTPVNFTVPSGASCDTPYPANSLPMGSKPWAIASDSSSSFVYITDFLQDLVFANQVNAADGTLTTSISGGVTGVQGYSVGDGPQDILVDPSGSYVYASSSGSNNIAGFSLSGGTGALTSLTGSPYMTGTLPLCMAIPPNYDYLFNVNQISGSVSGFRYAAGNGQLVVLQNQPFQVSSSTASGPTCIAIASN